MRNFFAETVSTRKQGILSGSFTVHKALGCKSMPGTCAVTQSIPHLTRNTWLCLARPSVWGLVLGTRVELIPMATAACPQHICRGPLSTETLQGSNGAKSISQAKSQLAENKAKNSSRRQEYSRRKNSKKVNR